MTIHLRSGNPADAPACGAICYEAFRVVCTAHGFPPDFVSVGAATEAMSMMLRHPLVHSVVAEIDGRIVGSNYLDERSSICGVGPISVDPKAQNDGVGRQLMEAVLKRSQERRAVGVRLLQAGFHNRSLGLYSTLGFRTREPVSILQGAPLARRIAGCEVRQATPADIAASNALCLQVHGFDRAEELRDAIAQSAASVVERSGRITAYTTSIAFFGHTVAETNTDLMALIGGAREFGGPGFLLPTRNHELFAWCLAAGLRLVYQMNLMTIGLYNEPTGAYLPSVLY
jgi:predicted N-acetyltransferase YhbS